VTIFFLAAAAAAAGKLCYFRSAQNKCTVHTVYIDQIF